MKPKPAPPGASSASARRAARAAAEARPDPLLPTGQDAMTDDERQSLRDEIRAYEQYLQVEEQTFGRATAVTGAAAGEPPLPASRFGAPRAAAKVASPGTETSAPARTSPKRPPFFDGDTTAANADDAVCEMTLPNAGVLQKPKDGQSPSGPSASRPPAASGGTAKSIVRVTPGRPPATPAPAPPEPSPPAAASQPAAREPTPPKPGDPDDGATLRVSGRVFEPPTLRPKIRRGKV